MSSSDRRTLLKLLAAAPLAACGFTPAFAPGGPAAGLMGAVRADDPHDKNAYDFVGEIEARLGTPQAPRYSLAYTLRTSTGSVGITASGAVTRYRITGSADYALHDIATGKTLTQGSVDSFTSYSAAGTPVTTLTDEEAANTRLMVILADQIADRLIATSGAWNG
ncbi:LPS assembly lipoprotein LptE [Solirhodobacter olei]|uniref:LPS assembly lipoprotein LptE n=1 Tax=Solirhodobacter olei TaxID=2493082 RepID=UPI000FDA1C66|nr:LPS assembly lipoprotein LptE [Solirhodobacter olei]